MLTILPLDEHNQSELNRADARFLAGERVQLRVTRTGFALDYVPQPTAVWRDCKPKLFEPARLLSDPRARCWLAFDDNRCIGQCVARLAMHGLCDVLDLRVDNRFRRRGVATELLKTCTVWAESMRRGGIRVEATDDQPAACQFLQSCGFELGGVDRLWHRADPDQQSRVPAMRESVLSFYKFF